MTTPRFAELKPAKLTDDFVVAFWDEQREEWRPSEEMIEFEEEEDAEGKSGDIEHEE